MAKNLQLLSIEGDLFKLFSRIPTFSKVYTITEYKLPLISFKTKSANNHQFGNNGYAKRKKN